MLVSDWKLCIWFGDWIQKGNWSVISKQWHTSKNSSTMLVQLTVVVVYFYTDCHQSDPGRMENRINWTLISVCHPLHNFIRCYFPVYLSVFSETCRSLWVIRFKDGFRNAYELKHWNQQRQEFSGLCPLNLWLTLRALWCAYPIIVALFDVH